MSENRSRIFLLPALLAACICFLGVIFCLTGCGTEKIYASDTKESKTENMEEGEIPCASEQIFAMDTYMTLTCYGKRAQETLEASLEEIQRLDALLSVGNADSEISNINSNGSGKISADTASMIETALDVYKKSGGAFDITIYPLMELWGFTTDTFSVPSQKAIDHLLSEVDSSKIFYNREEGSLTIGENQGIDLGGIAKGFTSTRIMEIFEEYELVSGLISLGGNVQCYRTKTDGSPWRCGIRNPLEPDNSKSLLGIAEIEDEAVITSGAYERNFTDENTGKTYHHIIDPSTGYSAEKGIISSTIISPDGTLADALSTTCYVMGLDGAVNYWKEYGDDFEMILMTEDGQVYITEGLKDRFTTDFSSTVIERSTTAYEKE